MTIADDLKAEGKLEGEIYGLQEALLRLLDKKFGLAEEEKEEILNIQAKDRLDRALDQCLDARSADEVLEVLR